MKNPIFYTLFFWLLTSIGAKAQDTIVFENKHVYLVEILEESETKVTYRKYQELDSLPHTLPKRFVTDIRYFNPSDKAKKFKPDTLEQKTQLDLWVRKLGDGGMVSGVLHQINDTMLVLKKQPSLFSGNRKGVPEMVHIIPYNQIDVISARQQNRIVQHSLFGAASGFILGTIAGMVLLDDAKVCARLPDGRPCDESLRTPFHAYEKALLLGFGSAGAGAVAGGIYGGIKVKIPVRGQRYLFNSAVPVLHRMKRKLKD